VRVAEFFAPQPVREARFAHAQQLDWEGLAGRVRRARYLANMSKPRWDQAVGEHEAILEALEKRDGAALGRVLKAHLQNKCETVKESFLSPSGRDNGAP
jgi:DNA-binding GntR family transcriptional regulator